MPSGDPATVKHPEKQVVEISQKEYRERRGRSQGGGAGDDVDDDDDDDGADDDDEKNSSSR